jgi:hypothetical protein
MFLGAVVLALETQQFKQKGAAPDVRRVIPDFSAQRLHRFVQLSGLE